MRKFILNVIIFFALVTVVDVCFGVITKHMIANSKGGTTKQMYDLCFKDNYDLLIMGSSRAHHHYVPDIIEDSCALSAYNAGYDGNGIILQYGIYKIITERYIPKVIVYDIYNTFDVNEYQQDCNNTRYIQSLKKFYEKKVVKEIAHSVNKKYDIYMLSNLYRYNGSMISIISDYILNRPMDKKGYAPLYGEYKGSLDLNNQEQQKDKTDSLKLHYLEKFMLATKEDGVELIVTISPSYNNTNKVESKYKPVIDLCKKHEIPFVNYGNVATIVCDNSLWKESVHMNDNGAIKFTRENVVPALKEFLSK